MTSTMTGLSSEQIAELLGKSRNRNAYGPKLAEFMESDEAGINPAEVWPIELGKKETSTLYQGFLLAAKKAGINEQVLIKQSDGAVFILHKERMGLLLNTEADSD